MTAQHAVQSKTKFRQTLSADQPYLQPCVYKDLHKLVNLSWRAKDSPVYCKFMAHHPDVLTNTCKLHPPLFRKNFSGRVLLIC